MMMMDQANGNRLPWRILLVDDNDDDLFLIQDLLEDEWPDGTPTPVVATASTYDEAIVKTASETFDLCLFDYRLGRRDGVDLLETVRCKGCTAPVILLTGQGDEEVAVAAMKAGAADYIPKRRLSPELLQHAVRYAIEMYRSEALRAEAERALTLSEERYRELVTTIPAAVCELDPDGAVTFVNPAVAEISGYREDELLGKNWWDIFAVAADVREAVGRLACLESPEESKRFELAIRAKDGGVRYLNWNVSCRFCENGDLQQLVCVGVDISELVHLREELKELAITDELTGLLNRRGFQTLARHQLRLAQRQEKDILLAYIDLDGMKAINDNLGHEKGDEALRLTAGVLRETFRESDVIGRLGGDEFAVLVAGGPDASEAAIRERLTFSLAAQPPRSDFKLELSVGVAHLAAGEKEDLEQLLERADGLMYENKQQRRAGRV